MRRAWPGKVLYDASLGGAAGAALLLAPLDHVKHATSFQNTTSAAEGGG